MPVTSVVSPTSSSYQFANRQVRFKAGGSKTQVTFHRSLVAGHCFMFWKVTKTLNLANPRPKVGFLA